MTASLVVGVLVVWSAWRRWQLLDSSPFPLGIDGYFYPVQLRSLLATGGLQYPAAPLAFYLLAPFAAIAGPLVGAKIGAAVLGALVGVPAYGVGRRLGGGVGAGLLAAVLATQSAGSTYMTIEFVKNGIGLTVALAAVWLGLRAIERPARGRVAAAVVAVLAAIATHKMAAAIAVGVLVPAALAEAVGRGALRGRRLLYVIGGGAVTVVVALGLGLAMPQRFLSPADLAQVHGLVSATPRWELPALVGDPQALPMGHEALLGGGLALLVAGALLLRRLGRDRRGALPGSPAERAAAGVLVVLALLIAIPWLDVERGQGLGFRLRVAAFVPMALLAAVALRALLAAVRLPAPNKGARPLSGLVLAALALVLPGPRARAEAGRVEMHPALVTAALALVGQLPRGAELVVPERHLAFMVAWYTEAPVALRPEAFDRARRYRLLPLSFIGPGSALDRALDDARREPALEAPLGLHPRYGNGFVLVAEPTWEWAMTRLPPRDRAYFTAWPVI